ncbi:MAG: hypothetical protein ABSE15_00965 [Candidatus Bathyarchaeia archaeon]|jgi:hypothetical protein
MPKGDNKTVINFTTELKQFADSNKGDLERSFHVALTYLAHYKDEFIAKYGQECYDAHVKRYGIPAIELRNNSVQRKKESLALKRRELELREKELELKTKFLNAETQIMNDKHKPIEEKEKNEKEREKVEQEKQIGYHKKKIQEYEQVIKDGFPSPHGYFYQSKEQVEQLIREEQEKIQALEPHPQEPQTTTTSIGR